MKKSIYTKECDFLRLWLKEKRNEANLNQHELSSRLGINQSILAKIETGERKISAIELVQYCEALKVDPVEPIEELKLMLRTNDSKKAGK